MTILSRARNFPAGVPPYMTVVPALLNTTIWQSPNFGRIQFLADWNEKTGPRTWTSAQWQLSVLKKVAFHAFEMLCINAYCAAKLRALSEEVTF
jgi:hypothetical protein